jgi:plastocyanin
MYKCLLNHKNLSLYFILTCLLALLTPQKSSAEIEAVVVNPLNKKYDFTNTIVWIEGKGIPKSKTGVSRSHKMDQINKQFFPRFLAIRVGDSVIYRNLDDVFHNVFSLDVSNKFDLGVFKRDVAYSDNMKKIDKVIIPKRTYPKAGKFSVFCNMHEKMSGSIFVFDHPYFSNLSKNGIFKFDLSPGTYQVTFAGPDIGNEIVKTIKFTKDEVTRIELSARDEGKTETHTKKDGSQYKDRSKKGENDDDEFY